MPEETDEELIRRFPTPWEVDVFPHPHTPDATIYAADSTRIARLTGPYSAPLARLIAEAVNEKHQTPQSHDKGKD